MEMGRYRKELGNLGSSNQMETPSGKIVNLGRFGKNSLPLTPPAKDRERTPGANTF